MCLSAFWRVLLVVFLLSFISQIGLAQSQAPAPTQQPERDAQAIAVVQTALAAMGGIANVSQVQNSVVQGTSVNQPSRRSSSQPE
jgi:hypothetical protein